MSGRADVIVLGGGISGLTAGFLLKEKGLETLVLEASPRPGGCITTWAHDGFLFEMGPNTVLNNALEIDDLCRSAGILDERLTARPASKKRYIVKNGRLVALPGGPLGFAATPLFSMGAKLRLLKEPFVGRAPRDAEESIAEFVRRRLGEEFLQYAVGPFVSGVYAGNPETLSVRHAVAKIYALERDHGGLIKGAFAKKKGPAPAGGLFSFPSGLQALPQSLARGLGDGFMARTGAVAVRREKDIYTVQAENGEGEVEAFTTRAVVSAVPARAAASILAPMGGKFPTVIGRLPYADVALVCLGFARESVAHPLDGFGFLAPEAEKRHVLGCLFPSSLFPGRAPEGFVALSAFVGGAVHPERAAGKQDEVVGKVLADLGPLVGISGEPVITRVEAWRPAIPQYNLGHGAFKDAASRFEADNPGTFISGNLLYGVSVGNCIQNATAVAGRVEAFLNGSTTV